MRNLIRLLLGPELLWLVFFMLTALAVKWTGAPEKKVDSIWVSLAYIVPFVGVPLTFTLYFIPGVERNWLLLRIWLACLIGGHYVLNKGLGAHSEQGPGVGTAYIMGLIFVLVVLFGGSIWYWIKSI